MAVKRKNSKADSSKTKQAQASSGPKTRRPPAKKPAKSPAKVVDKSAPKPAGKPVLAQVHLAKLPVKHGTDPIPVPIPAPPKPSHKALDAVPNLTDEDLRKVKTGLTRKDLEHYHDLLVQKRGEILGDVDSLQTDRNSKNAGGGNLSNMPLHMADVGTENYEQEFTLHLVESERRLLAEIDDALARIKNGTYGVCVERGVPINRARLNAKPWAKYCIEVAREKERMGLAS